MRNVGPPDGVHGREGEFDLPEGTIYPALHRLERTGAVASDWRHEQGRPRRVYRLTARGEAMLGAERRDWRRFVAAASRFLVEAHCGSDQAQECGQLQLGEQPHRVALQGDELGAGNPQDQRLPNRPGNAARGR